MTRETQCSRTGIVLVLLALMTPCVMAQTAKPQPRPVRRPARAISAHLAAVPARYAGVCPTKVQFKGTITTDGPAEVKYSWASFDGGTWPETTIKFTAAGTRSVSESREVFAPGQNGWMQLNVLAPNTLHSTQAKYTFTCRAKQPAAPKKK
ncbi:MAG TPA: hypothetical protein VJW20_19875 [Candidatus Angelobacter sp.]|nr:hypothetical protein [Candidatus Angelobacter sp.]